MKNYKRANQLAQQLRESKVADKEVFEELVGMCISELLRLRAQWQYFHIPEEEIKNEIAREVVCDAVMGTVRPDLPFARRLQNTFQRFCRKEERKLTKERMRKYAEYKQLLSSTKESQPTDGSWLINIVQLTHGSSSVDKSNTLDESQLSVEDQLSKKEFWSNIDRILANHDPLSKTIVVERSRKATIPEIANFLKIRPEECKRINAHDVYHLKKELKRSNYA